MECPICNTTIDDVRQTPFCPTCQWELLEIPNSSSDEMKRYYEELKKDFLKYYSQIKAKGILEVEVRKLDQNNEDLRKEIAANDDKTAQRNAELEKQRKELARLKKIQNEIVQANQVLSGIQQSINIALQQLALSDNYNNMLQELRSSYLIAYRNGYDNRQLKKIEKYLKGKKLL